MIKKFIAWIGAWTCFWIGHCMSYIVYHNDWTAHLYPMYNTFMGWSLEIQDWADLEGPWSKPTEDK